MKYFNIFRGPISLSNTQFISSPQVQKITNFIQKLDVYQKNTYYLTLYEIIFVKYIIHIVFILKTSHQLRFSWPNSFCQMLF